MILDTKKTGVLPVSRITYQDANLEIADQFKKELLALIDEGNPKVILNFETVTYIDSSFLGAMVAALKHAMSINGDIYLVGLRKDIHNMMQLIRMDKVFKIYTHAEDVA